MKHLVSQLIAFSCAFFTPVISVGAATAVVPEGSLWKYLDDGSDPGAEWRAFDYDDSSWVVGAGQLGYRDGDEATTLASSQIAYFFRHSFTIDDVSTLEAATLQLVYDDGAIVYLNGEEIHRTAQMPSSEEVSYLEPSLQYAPDNSIDSNINVPTSLFLAGINQLAVQVHNHSIESTDISFDLELYVDTESAGSGGAGQGSEGDGLSGVSQIRLIWVDDPTRTVTIAWSHGSGSDATVHYGTSDAGTDLSGYPFSASVARTATYSGGGIVSKFARLSGLEPNTDYYFVLSDDSGVSSRYWFRTASDTPRAFSFIAGGDSRNNRTPRQKANRMVAKLRPLFVAFTGDMIDSDSEAEWSEWLDDWQLTASDDGRMYPILPHRGNHESRGNSTIYELFDTTPENYYGMTFGGGLLRYYVLNSESEESTQTSWLQSDLDALGGAGAFTHLVAGYHKPMRPHVSSKVEGSAEYSAWAQLFYDNRFDLIFESDSHVMKRTLPIRPSVETGHDEGFVVDLEEGTIYVGEGCWGAPLREANDAKSWTTDSASFNGFDLVHVYEEHMELYTVQVDGEVDAAALPEVSGVLSLPAGIPLWQASDGARLTIARISDVPLSFSRFQMEAFSGAGVPTGGGVEADYDGDGVSNFFEFAYVLDPTSAESNNVIGARMPRYIRQADGAQGIAFRRRTGSTLGYQVETSETLTAWDPLVESVDYALSVEPGSGFEDVTYELIGDSAERERAFFKVTSEE